MRASLPIVVLLLALVSCRETPPGPGGDTPLSLKAVDASCTEVWLEVKLATGVQPRTLTLQRNSQTILATTLAGAETLIVDAGLLPNRPYTYAVTRPNGLLTDKATAAMTTLDTTSHNFTWQIDLLGDGSSSVLYDVAIINDTLAYAVGEMYLRDSTGQIDPIPYNAARWDGMHWQLMRIGVPIFCGTNTFPSSMRAVHAFSQNDIWMSSGITIMRGNGSVFTPLCIPQQIATGTINRIWGASANSVYCVGNNGTIAYYNGATWQRVESGTTIDVSDVYGSRNTQTSDLEILAVAGNPYVSSTQRKVFQLHGTVATVLSDSGINWSLKGVWFVPARSYFVVGAGIYQKRTNQDVRWRNGPLDITTFYMNAVEGTGINDVFACGAFGEVVHFNGITWKSFRSETGLANGQYLSIAVHQNQVIAVGSGGAILRGRRVQ